MASKGTSIRGVVYAVASIRVFPASHKDRHSGVRTPSIVAANGTNIATYGTRQMSLSLDTCNCTWPFIIADVKTPLRGTDFLQANALLVDLQSRSLINATSSVFCRHRTSHHQYYYYYYNYGSGKCVYLLSLPPHCSHKLHPRDAAFMKPFSTYYTQVVDTWLRQHPGRCVTIFQFASLFGKAYLKSATAQNAASGFRKTRIYPLDRHILLMRN